MSAINLTCACGNHVFREIQFVQQAQSFNAETGEYGDFEHLDADVRGVELRCRDCGADVTAAAIAAGHVLYAEPAWRELKPPKTGGRR